MPTSLVLWGAMACGPPRLAASASANRKGVGDAEKLCWGFPGSLVVGMGLSDYGSMRRDELPYGKLNGAIFDHVILPRVGRRRPEVIVPSQHDVDARIVDLGDGRVMVTTTDSVFIDPSLGWERVVLIPRDERESGGKTDSA